MEENKQDFGHIILCYFKKGKNTTNAKKVLCLCTLYGEGTVTDQTCQKWFAKFLGSIDIMAK